MRLRGEDCAGDGPPGEGGAVAALASPGLYAAAVGTLRLFFQGKCEQVQQNLGEVEKQLQEAQQKIQLNDLERSHAGGGEQVGALASRC